VTVWREIEERLRSRERDPFLEAVRVDADLDCVASWVSLAPGARVAAASSCDGCHLRGLASRGFTVEPFDPGDGGGILPSAEAPGGLPAAGLEAIVLFGRTLLPFWEVEETHRLHLRATRERLLPGGRLVFGDPGMLGRADLELPRLMERYAPFPEVRHDLRALGSRRRFTHYTAAQARTLLEQCGYDLERIHNGYTDGQPYEYHLPGMIFLCRRP
jgi:hypothetical protein